MSSLRLYFLFPESNPCNHWMCSSQDILDVEAVNVYLKGFLDLVQHLRFEEFEGFYDVNNVINFLEHFEILNDYYPRPITSIIRKELSGFYNWRDNPLQNEDKDYIIHHNPISDHTFCENAENGLTDKIIPNAVFSVGGHYLGQNFEVYVDGKGIEVISIENFLDIANWFEKHRNPKRNFQISIKHGENRQDIRLIDGEEIYPFRSSLEQGQGLVGSAVGHTKKEIFNYEEGKGYVVFKWEGENPQNMYHGYHVEDNSSEIPNDIKSILMQRRS